MLSSFDVTCIGNAKIDIFLTLHEANSHFRLIKETNEMGIKFGEKIAVDKAEILLGGNAANVAVGLSRLGLSSAIVAEIGKDEFAQKIIDCLEKEDVDTSNIIQNKTQQSSFSIIINYKNERTIFSEHLQRKHDFDFENLNTKWIYLTSLGNIWQEAYKKTLDFVKKTNAKLAFNPGTLQIACGKDELSEILKVTEILFINKEEALEILKINDQSRLNRNQILEIEELLKKLQSLGPKIAVITDGKNGSFAVDEKGKIYKKARIEIEVVEKTGAGDAYSSGFLSAIIKTKTIEEAMDWGTKNSASVIKKVGAQPGLLSLSNLEKQYV